MTRRELEWSFRLPGALGPQSLAAVLGSVDRGGGRPGGLLRSRSVKWLGVQGAGLVGDGGT